MRAFLLPSGNEPHYRHHEDDEQQHDAQQELGQPRPPKSHKVQWLVCVEGSVDFASVEKGVQHVHPRLRLTAPEAARMAKVFKDDLLAVAQVRQQLLSTAAGPNNGTGTPEG